MAGIVLHILGLTGPHKISGGQLLMVESVMRGIYNGWDLMYLTVVRRGLNRASSVGGDFCFPSFLCSFFFKRMPTQRLHLVVHDGEPREPCMMRWCEMMIREGGGLVGHFITQDIFAQWW